MLDVGYVVNIDAIAHALHYILRPHSAIGVFPPCLKSSAGRARVTILICCSAQVHIGGHPTGQPRLHMGLCRTGRAGTQTAAPTHQGKEGVQVHAQAYETGLR